MRKLDFVKDNNNMYRFNIIPIKILGTIPG